MRYIKNIFIALPSEQVYKTMHPVSEVTSKDVSAILKWFFLLSTIDERFD